LEVLEGISTFGTHPKSLFNLTIVDKKSILVNSYCIYASAFEIILGHAGLNETIKKPDFIRFFMVGDIG
jgi:hypothetical protein